MGFSLNKNINWQVAATRRLSVMAREPRNLDEGFLRNAGSREMAVDGTGGLSFDFVFDDDDYLLSIELVIVDNGINWLGFMGSGTPLTNGFDIDIVDVDGTTVLFSFLNSDRIQRTADLALLSPSQSLLQSGSTLDLFAVDILQAASQRILRINEGQRLRLTLNDDMTFLDSMQCFVRSATREIADEKLT